ncbi:cell division protein FtsK [Candidatus Uhrbacteria bacterium CG10_big_fil_rev_8_21_14_0_10_48_16]|uniref:Cell division protein FtsK n=1 Tax=Candidatus Uhrbacteria bacterium CG10_big_fil_rev_8_21_14_0_10_48_16 TaxID=1975038 RepID=A0A2M8LHZ6_9BACT|nr:MAG: cell division protein FtsK [Candidatus Uhrbacteria bacterium CG10_big_fil_rev_8_21_14_0_10_48_16]
MLFVNEPQAEPQCDKINASMARKKKRSTKKRSEHVSFELNPETKRGIYVILLFAIAVLIFLSYFHIAGSVGVWINALLASFFGLDRYIVPLILIIIGATLAYPERGKLSTWNYLGLLFFFLSFNALMNLFLVNRPEPFTQDLTMAGGYLGQFLATLLSTFIGYWGSIVSASALLLVSVLLIFNTSLRSLVGVHSHLTGWLGELIHKKSLRHDHEETEEDEYELEEEEDELEDEQTEEDVEEDGEEEVEDHRFHTKPVQAPAYEEVALVSRTHREIAIPMSLLLKSNSKAHGGDTERNKEIIEKTFQEFGINVEMGKISIGPTVTQYTLRPMQGVKLSRIVSLQNDLALALAAHPLRLEAPIPGQSLVGIEVPNHKVATVTLRDVMETNEFKASKSPLSLPLGKDVSGSSYTIALDKMPHMLVAGATGSGKSVCLNTMIVSWLYQNGPDDLKLILVDPKRVELTSYNGIPHLLVPPIISADDTVNALKWTIREMERRLDLLSKVGARNIDGYNEKAEERMPRIVFVIDELADLMSVSGREVEGHIVRIAQMARAVGIHLVLATQRPSVDVITGLIKANVPGRIAFAVASQTDSRTILDQAGAEKLLGRGDMLFTSADVAKPKRLQGAFISTEEVEAVVKHLRRKGEPDYNMAVTEITKAGTVFDDLGEQDDMLDEAIQTVLESGKASTSYLQRRLRLGYARAARIIDMMEDAGVIGPGQGAKPREVLIESWPPGSDATEGMPTAQDDYDEAYKNEDRFSKDDKEPEMEEERFEEEEEDMSDDEPMDEDEEAEINWEDQIDDSWIEKEEEVK